VIGFAAIAPHGDVDAAPELRAAMDELGRRFEASRCTTAVVVTPHNVHVDGNFAVVTSGRVGAYATDRALSLSLLESARGAGLPAVGVSFGGNDPVEAEMPLDWGTEVPLDFAPAERIVVVAPARDRPLDEHVELGRLIGGLSGDVALVASADHGHAHDAQGPYGFHEAARAYDDRFLELLEERPLDFRPLAELVENAKADSLWQLLVFQGAVGDRPVELLAYSAPTYYGMAVALAG
jgi:aromatic ring-opening dioxygenase LigB subunit